MGAMLSAMPVTAADTTHQPKKIPFACLFLFKV